MTSLAYIRAKQALSSEIRHSLETQARTLTQQIEATLFERIKDLQEWRRLDLMQDVKVGDVDKRLSRFLLDIKSAYAGIYDEIFCSAGEHIVASSNAAHIGSRVANPKPWLNLKFDDGDLYLSRPSARDPSPEMILRSKLFDAFSAKPLGHIHAYWNWQEIISLLDRVTLNSQREVILLDKNAGPIAVSSDLRRYISEREINLAQWPMDGDTFGVFNVKDEQFELGDLLVGYAHASGYRGLPDLGWTVMVLTPVDAAFGPVRKLLYALLGLLISSLLIGGFIAIRLSARTAKPLQALTDYTRTVGQDIDTPAQTFTGGKEVTELSLAFNNMIEDIKASRDRLIRVSKLATVGEMAAKLAHEVRTPLGIIRSSAQLLDRQATLDERGHEMMSFMIHECDRINQLVTGLLESARPRQPVWEQHDLNEIVTHVADMLGAKLEQKNITLDLPDKHRPIIVRGDRDQLIQVLLNLLMNALQIIEPGGRIRVSTSTHDASIELRVEDDGPGVPSASREPIFEPLVSERSGGIGLGLSIVREIINMHHGTIKVIDSDLGGACFVVTLPIKHPDTENAAP